jgi:hypothetical protein
MTAAECAALREWCSIMPGDVVTDGSGRARLVTRAQVERVEGGPGDDRRILWLSMRDNETEVVVRIPMRGHRADGLVMTKPGPGWDLGTVRSTGPEAMRWASDLISRALGGREIAADSGDGTTSTVR